MMDGGGGWGSSEVNWNKLELGFLSFLFFKRGLWVHKGKGRVITSTMSSQEDNH